MYSGRVSRTFSIGVLPGRFAVCRLAPGAALPDWADAPPWCAIVRTAAELSVVCPAAAVPPGVRHEPGWSALALEGPFAFDEVGVLAAVLAPLAQAGIGVFAVSTFDTDYVLVKAERLDAALEALRTAGHHVDAVSP